MAKPDAPPEMTDVELRRFVTQTMADAGATPAAVYAFHKTGVCLTEDNEGHGSPELLRAWNDAVNQYHFIASRTSRAV